MQNTVGDEVRGEACDPLEDRWRAIATPPSPGNVLGSATWTGDEVVWVAYDAIFPASPADSRVISASAYDPDTETWRTLPPLPVRFAEGIPSVGVSNGSLYVIRYPTLISFVDGFWLSVPARADVWPDEFIDSSIGPIGFREYQFVPMDLSAQTDGPLTVQMGRLAVEIGGDDRVVGSQLLEVAASAVGVQVDLDTPTGACTVATEFRPDELAPPYPPQERAPGEVEALFDDGGPLLAITCADTPTAMRLAEAAALSP